MPDEIDIDGKASGRVSASFEVPAASKISIDISSPAEIAASASNTKDASASASIQKEASADASKVDQVQVTETREVVVKGLETQHPASNNSILRGNADGTWNVIAGSPGDMIVPPHDEDTDTTAWMNTKISEIQSAYPSRHAIHFDLQHHKYHCDETLILKKSVAGSHVSVGSTARRGALMIKQGDGDRTSNVLIDMQGSDECELKNISFAEQDTFRNCCLTILGGTTSKIESCWYAGAADGIIGFGGGMSIVDTVIENCDQLMLVASRYWNPYYGIARSDNNTSHANLRGLILQNNVARFMNFMQVELNLTSGTLAIGDEITVVTGGGNIVTTIEMYEEIGGEHWILVPWEQGSGMTVADSYSTNNADPASGTIASKVGSALTNINVTDLDFAGTVATAGERNQAVLVVDGASSFNLANSNIFDHGWFEIRNSEAVVLTGSSLKSHQTDANKGLQIINSRVFINGHFDRDPVVIDSDSTVLPIEIDETGAETYSGIIDNLGTDFK